MLILGIDDHGLGNTNCLETSQSKFFIQLSCIIFFAFFDKNARNFKVLIHIVQSTANSFFNSAKLRLLNYCV